MEEKNSQVISVFRLQKMLNLSLRDITYLLLVSKSMASLIVSRKRNSGKNTSEFMLGLNLALSERWTTLPPDEEIKKIYALPDTASQKIQARIVALKLEIWKTEKQIKEAVEEESERLKGLFLFDNLQISDQIPYAQHRNSMLRLSHEQLKTDFARGKAPIPELLRARLAGLQAELKALEELQPKK